MNENILYRVMAEFYDFVPPYCQRNDVGFYVDLAKSCGGPALELGCGTGRITLPIAAAGIDIVGLDYSPAMLEVASQKLLRLSAEVCRRVCLLQGDMRNFNYEESFALIIVPFHGFQHLLTVEDQLACLNSIQGCLQKNGTLVIDAFNPNLSYLLEEKYLQEWGDEPEFTMPDGRRVQRRFRTLQRDLSRQLLDIDMIHYIYHPDGREEKLTDRIAMRYFFRYELEHLISRGGFAVKAVYGDYDHHPFATGAAEIIVVAEKA